jgi:hypothetical protein
MPSVLVLALATHGAKLVALVHSVTGLLWAGAALMDAESVRPRRVKIVVRIFAEERVV